MTFVNYTDQVVVEGHDNIRHFEANEDIKQGQLVKRDSDSSARTVEPSDTDGEQAIGFAQYDVSSGEEVAVAVQGAVVRATGANGTISSDDDFVASHGSSGEEGEIDTAASGDYIVGVPLEDEGTAGNEGNVIVLVSLGQYGD